jgi:hypothetical protein
MHFMSDNEEALSIFGGGAASQSKPKQDPVPVAPPAVEPVAPVAATGNKELQNNASVTAITEPSGAQKKQSVRIDRQSQSVSEDKQQDKDEFKVGPLGGLT